MKAWEANIRHVTPYTPGEQPDRPDMVKLNTNENPYPPAKEVREALHKMETEALRLYPDPAASQLTNELARFYGLTPEQVFVGVGSDDVLAMCFLTFFNSKKPVLFPDITYSFYHVWAELFGVPYERPALDGRLHLRKEDYYRENGGVIFPNPNAPTGVAEPLSDIEDILEHNTDVIVIVDEAYVDFGARSAISLLETYENLLVVQTFSKSRSLAGLRIGYALGNPALIRALNDVKYSFNSYTLNRPALEAGTAALQNEAYWRKTLAKIVATRERAKKRLAGFGFTFEDSQANFLFVTHPVWKAEPLFLALRKSDIYVRYFKQPRIDNYLRITIGTEKEMERLYTFLEKYQEETGGDVS
ncbi:MAG: histidinol-phosphate transaminase [Lachnospiraceae bacterium]|jgi:histidinol-phosphate aminotransferase|nr:histidinol-phosphate transaminase [Lachnospiraceae bacterium]